MKHLIGLLKLFKQLSKGEQGKTLKILTENKMDGENND